MREQYKRIFRRKNMPEENLQQHINQEFKEILVKHEERLTIANSEMGSVKSALGIVQTDIGWIKQQFETINTRVWWVLGSIVLGILVQILFKVFGK